MYTKILVPLDGSAVAEQVLPYVRTLAGRLKIPVEFVGVVDMEEFASHTSAEKGQYVEPMIADSLCRSGKYLEGVAQTFPYPRQSCGGYHCEGSCGEENAYHYGNAWPFGI